MEIDLNFSDEYELNEVVNIPKEYISIDKVKKLDNIKVVGKIYYSVDDNVSIKADISGTMILEDDISLDDIEYPFSIKYDDIIEENLINDENRLDLFEFLWENIVLEVPLKFTKVTNLSEFHGDGWKLVSEDEQSLENNPFHDLLKDFDKKE
jgi:uncharacterized metal-binding protein YceD (DUF177 family)